MPRSKLDFEDAAEAAPEEQDARWGGHYDALGISHGASVDDVRTAYSLRVLQAHPDKGGQLRVEDQAEGERQACQDAEDRGAELWTTSMDLVVLCRAGTKVYTIK